MSIPFVENGKRGSIDYPYQTENLAVEPDRPWLYNGDGISWQECLDLKSNDPLWTHASGRLRGDRIPIFDANLLTDSLRMVQVDELEIFVVPYDNRSVKGRFQHAGRGYELKITDPRIENWCRENHHELPARLSNCCIVASLGVPFKPTGESDEFVFLLIAAVLQEDDRYFQG